MLWSPDVLVTLLLLLGGQGVVPGTAAGPAPLPGPPAPAPAWQPTPSWRPTWEPAVSRARIWEPVGDPTPSLGPTPRGTWPLRPEPAVHARFDPPAQDWLPGHRGVDLVGSPGQWVHSGLPGVVGFAGAVGGKQVVVVDHGPTRTTYEPVLADVSVGDRVAAGDRIGWLLGTPSHCAPTACLHWGWRRGDRYLDPLLLVGGARPVRLLPLCAPAQARGWACR